MHQEHRYFITGTGTGVGKTYMSAILCKKLNATYYKPIQSGSIFSSDENFVKNFGVKTIQSTYNFPAPESPNIAGNVIQREIDLNEISIPKNGNLIVEGAGGLMTPISNSHLIIDLIEKLDLETIIVAKTSLGTINSTLLTYKSLINRGIRIKGLIMNGTIHKETVDTILKFCNVNIISQIETMERINDENLEKIVLSL